MNPSISVFFPTYNEEENVEKLIIYTDKILRELTKVYEIIIVNDGSTDKTLEIISKLQEGNSQIKIVSHKKNQGYGKAIRSGIQVAIYDYIFFSDSDLQFDLGEINKLLPYANKYDAVIGYRKKRKDPFMRLVNSKIWNIANRLLFGIKFRDINCAFKIFNSKSIKDIPLYSDGAMISAEILFKMQNKGCKIKEVGVNHFPRLSGKPTGAKISVIIKSLKEMFSLYTQQN